MRHDQVACFRQLVDPEQETLSSDVPRAVQRERIPEFVDKLDCLLTLWVAEATLDNEAASRTTGTDRSGNLGQV